MTAVLLCLCRVTLEVLVEHGHDEYREQVCHHAPQCTPLVRFEGSACMNGHPPSDRNRVKTMSVRVVTEEGVRVVDASRDIWVELTKLSKETKQNKRIATLILYHASERFLLVKLAPVSATRSTGHVALLHGC